MAATITREQLAKLLEGIATSHFQIHTYGWGDVPDLLAREDVIYPFLMVTPQASVYGDNTINHTYTLSIADRVLKNKENEVTVDSDTHQYLMDVVTQLDNLLYDDVDLIKGVTVTPFFDNFRHEVTGHFANVTVQVMYNYDACAIPSDNVDLPIPPPDVCLPASYRVQYVDGTLIEEGTIPSGGSVVVDVPLCEDATYELRDSAGVLIESGSIASGGSATITAPNGVVTVTDSAGSNLYVVSVVSDGAATQAIGDSTAVLKDTAGVILSTTSIKAEASEDITAPDGTVSVVNSANDVVDSGAVKSNGTSTFNAPDGTVNVRKSDNVLIEAKTVKSDGVDSAIVADSAIRLEDSAAGLISNTNVKATDPATIVAPDGTVNVRDSAGDLIEAKTVKSNGTETATVGDSVITNDATTPTYTQAVKATEGLVLPAQSIEVNDVVEGSINSVGTIDINLTDGTDPVVPISVGISGRVVTVEVPSGGAPPTGTFLVRFFDIDGTILKEERRNAGQDATAPSNPNYDPTYLVFAEWNQAFTNVQNDIDVGAIYDTIDGKTYLFLRITDVTGLQPTLQLNKITTDLLTIDWGDSTTNTSTTSGNQTITKTAAYAAIGDYVVTIEDSGLYGTNTVTGYLLGNNVTYSSALLTLYMGENMRFNNTPLATHRSLSVISINKNTDSKISQFLGCVSLIHANIPNTGGVFSNMFTNCNSLESVSIPPIFTSATQGFLNCRALKKVIIPSVTTWAGNQAFENCNSLETLIVSNSLTKMGGFGFVRFCSSLKNFKIPTSLTTIDNLEFEGCISFTSLEFPDTVTSVGGNQAFGGCTSILEYTFLSTTPPTNGGANTFNLINAACKIYVPDANVAAYKAATNWTVVANYIFPLSTKP